MRKVNVSRLNIIISNEIRDLAELRRGLSGFRLGQSLRIFDKTGDSTLEEFKNRAGRKRERFFDLLDEAWRREEHIAYLKGVRDSENHKSGVSGLMIRHDAIQRRIDRLRMLASMEAPDGAVAIGGIQPLDVYKSSYTETNRIYDLDVSILDDSDLEAFKKLLEQAEREAREVGDKIAELNQGNFVEIRDIDDKVPE